MKRDLGKALIELRELFPNARFSIRADRKTRYIRSELFVDPAGEPHRAYKFFIRIGEHDIRFDRTFSENESNPNKIITLCKTGMSDLRHGILTLLESDSLAKSISSPGCVLKNLFEAYLGTEEYRAFPRGKIVVKESELPDPKRDEHCRYCGSWLGDCICEDKEDEDDEDEDENEDISEMFGIINEAFPNKFHMSGSIIRSDDYVLNDQSIVRIYVDAGDYTTGYDSYTRGHVFHEKETNFADSASLIKTMTEFLREKLGIQIIIWLKDGKSGRNKTQKEKKSDWAAAEEAFEKAKESGCSQKLEQIVIDSGDPYWAYEFAKDIRGANVSKLQQVVVDSGDPRRAFYFARDIRGANVSKLEQVVIDYGNPILAYNFARYVKGANISKLQQAVVNSGNSEWIDRFANNVKGANVSKLKAILAGHKIQDDDTLASKDDAGASYEREGEKKMGKNTNKTSTEIVKDAFVHGGKVAAASTANAKILEIVRAHLGDSYPDFFRKGFGQTLEPFLIPFALLVLTDHVESFPKREHVRAAVELALEAGARDRAEEILKELSPIFDKIAGIVTEKEKEAV